MTSTIDEKEIKKFSDMADEWWSPTGKFKPLHKFNPTRILYIREQICAHFKLDFKSLKPFSTLKIIDIGCGGGLVAEPFANMGANVTAIDASAKNIEIAKIHAQKSGLKIDYRNTSTEEITQAINHEKFDVVLALEVIEHVSDVGEFVKHCAKLLNDNGILFVATLNRTAKSFLFAKVGAEYVLRWLPAGTHDWKKFLKPSEVASEVMKQGLDLQELAGFSYNPFNDTWKVDAKDLDVNYIAVFKRN